MCRVGKSAAILFSSRTTMSQAEFCTTESARPGLLVSNKPRRGGGCDLQFAFDGKKMPLWSTGMKGHRWCSLQPNQVYSMPTHRISKKPCFANVPVRPHSGGRQQHRPQNAINIGISNSNSNKAVATAHGGGRRPPYVYPGVVYPGVLPPPGVVYAPGVVVPSAPTYILPPEKYIVPVPGDTYVINPAQPAQPYAPDNLLGLPPVQATTTPPPPPPPPTPAATEPPPTPATEPPAEQETPEPEIEDLPQYTYEEVAPKSQGFRLNMKMLICVMVVAAILGVAFYLWRRKRATPNIPRGRIVFL